MKSTGIVRNVDEVGRVVLPKELRKSLGIEENTPLEIFTSGDKIVLRKYMPADIFTGEVENLVEYMGKKVSVKTIKILAELAGLTYAPGSRNEFEIDDEIDNL